MGFVVAGRAQAALWAAQGCIPQPAIINGLTSTSKKREARKRRTKEIPADSEKTN